MEIPSGFKFYKDDIGRIATQHGLEPYVVAAVVWQESAFNTDAYRFEPDFWNRYLKMKIQYRHLNPRRVSASYGLMQVMYPLVLEDKLTDNDALPPEHLFVPEHGLQTGCRHLASCIQWATSFSADPMKIVLSALAAYNGGRSSDNRPTSPLLRNGKYATEVSRKHTILAATVVY